MFQPNVNDKIWKALLCQECSRIVNSIWKDNSSKKPAVSRRRPKALFLSLQEPPTSLPSFLGEWLFFGWLKCWETFTNEHRSTYNLPRNLAEKTCSLATSFVKQYLSNKCLNVFCHTSMLNSIHKLHYEELTADFRRDPRGITTVNYARLILFEMVKRRECTMHSAILGIWFTGATMVELA